jgi:hypothetical protein
MGKTKRKADPAPESLTPFLAPLQAVQELMEEFGGRGVIIGWVADPSPHP